MKDWFANLEQREQWFVGIGGIVAILVILWALVWIPFDKGHNDLRTSVSTWEGALADLRVIRASMDAAPSTGPARPVATAQSPVVVVDQTLRERALSNAATRQQPTPNGVRVEFENVVFDQLVLWLGDLSNQHAMEVQAGNLRKAAQAGPGRINASLTLERAP